MSSTLPSSCRPGEIYVLREGAQDVSYFCSESGAWLRNTDSGVMVAVGVCLLLALWTMVIIYFDLRRRVL
jgi:hypothetical protein